MFAHVAEALAPQFRRTLYFAPWKTSAFLESRWHEVGMGLEGVERVDDVWRAAQEADIVIFPDVYTDDIRDELHRQGKLTWGPGREAADLENNRWRTRSLIKSFGLPVTNAQHVVGIPALRKLLERTKDKWVKHGVFRADIDTFHHIDWAGSQATVDMIAHKMGPVRQLTAEFVVEDPIEPAIEIGVDGFSVDGKTSATVFYGIEVKSAGVFSGQVVRYRDLPRPLREVHERFRPALKNYRGFFSTEVRITKSGLAFFIDPCVRCGSPPSELYMSQFSNWADVIVQGAQGNVIDLVPTAKYGVLATVECESVVDMTIAVNIPPAMRRRVKLRNNLRHEGRDYVIRNPTASIGRAIGIGDSWKAALADLQKAAEAVTGYGVGVDLADLPKVEETWREVERAAWR